MRNLRDDILILTTHPPILETRTLHWPDEAACARFASAMGEAIAAQPALGDAIVELDGPLGAGKTTFTRHLLRSLGVTGRIKSPTYAVVEPYEIRLPDGRLLHASHFDFYRFNDPREWNDAGFRDTYVAPGLKLAEWASKAAPHLPAPDLSLSIEPVIDPLNKQPGIEQPGIQQAFEAQRRVHVRANTLTGLRLLESAMASAQGGE